MHHSGVNTSASGSSAGAAAAAASTSSSGGSAVVGSGVAPTGLIYIDPSTLRRTANSVTAAAAAAALQVLDVELVLECNQAI